MGEADTNAALQLLEKGSLVHFETLDTEVSDGTDEAEFGVRITLRLRETEDDNDVEWGAHGFMFALALLSFSDARARGMSEREFQENDQLRVADFLEALTYEQGRLQFHGDYAAGA